MVVVEVEEEEEGKAVRAISKHGLVLGLILRGEAAACVLPAASDRRAVQNQETWFALFHSTPPNPLRRPDRQKTLLGGAATFFRGCYFFLGGLVRDCGVVGWVIPNIELEKLMIDQKFANYKYCH